MWLTIGIVGQTLWTARFLVQWWSTERAGASHFPRLFWWLSLSGNALLLAYAIHLRDAVYIAGFVPGPIVQIRNLMLHRADGTEAVAVEAPRVANPPLSSPAATSSRRSARRLDRRRERSALDFVAPRAGAKATS